MTRSNTRGGFLILMLIAFSSIILGLSVTFYLYCTRGIDDSQVAVRIAQRRLALQAAMNALYSAPDVSLYAGTGMTVDLEIPAIKRTKNLGWYRIRKADSTYVPPAGIDLANSVFVTAGSGPSGGDTTWDNPAAWQNEYRTWYFVEMTAATAGAPKQILPVFPPPAGFW
jgi:hypothetical protein